MSSVVVAATPSVNASELLMCDQEPPQRLESGRSWARNNIPGGPCIVCKTTRWVHRHHVDGNTNNNAATNIMLLCARHHMDTDGRIDAIRARSKRSGDAWGDILRSRTTCKHGHVYPVRPLYKQRSDGRFRRRCRPCERKVELAKRGWFSKRWTMREVDIT